MVLQCKTSWFMKDLLSEVFDLLLARLVLAELWGSVGFIYCAAYSTLGASKPVWSAFLMYISGITQGFWVAKNDVLTCAGEGPNGYNASSLFAEVEVLVNQIYINNWLWFVKSIVKLFPSLTDFHTRLYKYAIFFYFYFLGGSSVERQHLLLIWLPWDGSGELLPWLLQSFCWRSDVFLSVWHFLHKWNRDVEFSTYEYLKV